MAQPTFITDLDITFEDSRAPFWMLRKNGYYIVGSKNYAHKINALIEASRSGNKIKWEFGSDVFDKINWRQPVDIGLAELYRMRAQQLRDRYDYLILAFSGGADSSNVLDSFLNNNIHLDEVLVHWPRRLTQGHYRVSTDTTAYNVLSEWELAVIPKLEHIRNNYPKIKITIDDLEDLSDEYSEDAITIAKDKFHYLNVKRQRGIARRSSELMNKNLNVATIYGFDKPRLMKVNNVLCAFFGDEMASVVSDLVDGYERNIEYFYWAVDLPELPVKQCQTIYSYLLNNPQQQKYVQHTEMKSLNQPMGYPDSDILCNVEIMRGIITDLLYPTWNPQTFQAAKPTYFGFKCEYHAWINQGNQSHRFIESWSSAFGQYTKLIGEQFNYSDDGRFQAFSTKLYPLGVI